MSGSNTIDDPCFASAVDLAAAYRRKAISPVEVMQALLARIEQVNPRVNAFLTLLPEQALQAARDAEQALMSTPADELPALHGIPVSVKDLSPTAGVRTTYGVRQYIDNVPTEDGVAWARLKAQGAILFGKTSTPPFGWLGVTENALIGTTNNPWDTTRTAGGSSGGAAAAIAAGMGPLAMGSDGGGSIRIPAACCGVVGLKCSLGRIPRVGDTDPYEAVTAVGPLARTVADVAWALSLTAGPDERDPFGLPPSDIDFLAHVQQPSVRGLRIALCPDLDRGPMSADVRAAIANAARIFERELGASVDVVKLDLPDAVDYFLGYWPPAVAVYWDDGEAMREFVRAYPFFEEVIARGRQMSAVDHWRVAMQIRGEIHGKLARLFSSYDLLLTATMPLAAFPHAGPVGGAAVIDGVRVPHPEIEFHRLTEPFGHTGHPAISIPCGFSSDGLPIGLQIIGRHRADADVLAAAAAFETVAPWARRPPC